MRKIMRFLVRKVPRKYLIRFSGLFSSLISLFYYGNKYQCPICESKLRKFLPYGNKGNDNRLCPKCLSLERHRLIWLFLKNKTDFFTNKLKVLHIAPEQSFYYKFKKLKNIEYTTADLESPLAKVKMDIRKMPFENNSFDFVLCNHVLEHIDNEELALSEIYRVMKPGACAILQVPIDLSREVTYEDNSITDPAEREKIFGQYDHLRVHGRDYPDRIAKCGLKVNVDNYVHTLDPDIVERYRLPATEMIYFACK